MASPLGLSDLGAQSVELSLAIGIGAALAAALEPVAVSIRQHSFAADPSRVPDAGTLAAGVAQGQVDRATAAAWAREHGYDTGPFAALVDIANTGPALGYAYQAWRRGHLSEGEFTTALRRTGLEEQWYDALRALKGERLDLGAIATAVHRGILRGPGLIVREPPTGGGRVPFVAPSDLDPRAEAEAHGVDAERLRVLVGNTGLPPGLIEMLRLFNMGEVEEDDVRRAVAQSNLRNEYMDVVFALRRRLLTPHEYEEAALRGIVPREEADAGAALSGMRHEDARLLFETMGRPLPVRAITTGLARGGRLGGGYDDVPEPYRDAIRRSNIRPEYARLAYANRYSLPSAFVLRSMAQAGELERGEVERLLLETGWPPELAAKVSAKWAGGVAGAAKEETRAELLDEYAGGYMTERELRAALGDLGYAGHTLDLYVHLADARRVKRWREKVVDAVAAAYLAHKIGDDVAASELAEVNVTGEAAARLLDLWRKQRRDTVTTLTAAQVAKAYRKNLMDQATALEELEERGYSAEDAATLLRE